MNSLAPVEEFLNISDEPLPDEQIIVVGAGPVGIRVAQELGRAGKNVIIFNSENVPPYNRVKLTPLLSSDVQIGQVFINAVFAGTGNVDLLNGVSVIEIDTKSNTISASDGKTYSYSKLVLATGSRAREPNVSGIEKRGVYVFRNMTDAEALIARSISARNVAVIGGGLLGLEVARGLKQRGAKVTVIEHNNRLMSHQLNNEAAVLLKEKVEKIGLRILTGKRLQSVNGEPNVQSISLESGEELEVDTVVVCAGVIANTQLAQATDLKFGRGVIVDAQMRTSNPNIYAVGECAQFENVVHGLVGPGYEQASTAVSSILGEPDEYAGSIPCTKLKVVGADVFSMGHFESFEQVPSVRSHVYESKEDGIYRCIFVDRGKLVAALGVGDWPEATKIQQAVQENASVNFWNTGVFRKEGKLWRGGDDDALSMPASAIICNCTGVTKGAISNSITLGATTIEEVREATSANTVCGSCSPLVNELLGQGDAKIEPVKWWRYIIAASGIATLAALATLFLPRIQLADTFNPNDMLREFWFSNSMKQISGYTILALTVGAAILGLRKRIKFLMKIGDYDSWRIIHLGIGIACALLLVWHTGFRLGSNLNMALMLCFLATLVFGAISGFATGGDASLREQGLVKGKKSAKTIPLWVHILALWPLPALLIVHIVSVYSY